MNNSELYYQGDHQFSFDYSMKMAENGEEASLTPSPPPSPTQRELKMIVQESFQHSTTFFAKEISSPLQKRQISASSEFTAIGHVSVRIQKTITAFKERLEQKGQEKAQARLKREGSFHIMSSSGEIGKVMPKQVERVRIPQEIPRRFQEWRASKGDGFFLAPHRTPYTEADIPLALKAFEEECGCSWQKMKHQWGGEKPGFIQIINDLRAMEIEAIGGKLQAKFPGLKIHDFGSNNPTSDRDLSLSVPGHPEEEAAAVKLYNELFTTPAEEGGSGWKGTAAMIFDNNAYTQFHVVSLHQLDTRSAQQDQQNLMSLVMYRRNAGPKAWENLKEEALKNSEPSVKHELQKKFTLVESSTHVLGALHDQAIVRTGVVEMSKMEDISGLPDLARRLEGRNPHLLIEVDNSLHDDFRKQIEETLIEKNTLDLHIKKIQDPKTDPESALAAYQTAAETASAFIDAQMERLQAQWQDYQKEAARIGDKDPKEATAIREGAHKLKLQMELLKSKKKFFSASLAGSGATVLTWGRIRKEQAQVRKELQNLKNLPMKLEMLKKKAANIESRMGGTNHAEMREKLIETNSAISRGVEALKTTDETENRLRAKLDALAQEKLDLPAGAVSQLDACMDVSEQMQLAIENAQMMAQCFAQEAHVTAGAYTFVVEDTQQGKDKVRDLGAYMQGTTELMGFYHAHQSHAKTPEGMMVEVSKYVGPRLMVSYERMDHRATSQGLVFPKMEKLEELRDFFNEIFPLRGGKIHPDTVKHGLAQIGDEEIQKELMQCRTQRQASELLEKRGMGDKFELISRFFPTEKGGLEEGQIASMVREIGVRHGVPLRPDGSIDSRKIDAYMNAMHAKALSWTSALSHEQSLSLGTF